jgi:hypothetical protein
LKKTKNERLHQLIAQTDEYLNTMVDLIEAQKSIFTQREQELKQQAAEEQASQGEALDSMQVQQDATTTTTTTSTSVGEGQEAGDAEGEVAGAAPKIKTYYAMAHSIEEEIKVQPAILEGGQLKPYQVLAT